MIISPLHAEDARALGPAAVRTKRPCSRGELHPARPFHSEIKAMKYEYPSTTVDLAMRSSSSAANDLGNTRCLPERGRVWARGAHGEQSNDDSFVRVRTAIGKVVVYARRRQFEAK